MRYKLGENFGKRVVDRSLSSAHEVETVLDEKLSVAAYTDLGSQSSALRKGSDT